MTLQEFKNEAARRGHTFDNSDNASRAWSRSWGLTWWRDVWFYREYRLGAFTYRTGRVRQRHHSYTNTEYRINDSEVSQREFLKALDTFQAPALSADEQSYIQQQEQLVRQAAARRAAWHRSHPSRSRRQTSSDHAVQLTFNFAA